MAFNGLKQRSKREFSEYQKAVEAIDNVILCVAEAEKMIREIGSHMAPENDVLEQLKAKSSRRSRPQQGIGGRPFR